MKRLIIGIYLAAGRSTRFKGNKLLAPAGSIPLGCMALHTALQSNLDKIIVVTGRNSPMQQMEKRCSWMHHPKLLFISCEDAAKGQSYSIRCGVNAAQRFHPAAIMIILADQPLISKAIIQTLLSCFHTEPASPFITCSYHGIPHPPVLFSSLMFHELTRLQGDKGARKLLQKTSVNRQCFIDSTDVWSFFDVDTISEYKRLLAHINSRN